MEPKTPLSTIKALVEDIYIRENLQSTLSKASTITNTMPSYLQPLSKISLEEKAQSQEK